MAPNDFPVVDAVYDTGLYNLATHDGQAAFVDAVVSALHAKDRKWGHLKKSGGQTQIHGHAEDAALYLSDTPGQSQAVDFITGAGGPNAQPGWLPDTPRYSASDWFSPVGHMGTAPTPPPTPQPPPVPVYPPYPGDPAFDAVGVMLFADYAEAHAVRPDDPNTLPNAGMGRWFGRVEYDWLVGNVPTLDASIAKHRPDWRAALGLP